MAVAFPGATRNQIGNAGYGSGGARGFAKEVWFVILECRIQGMIVI